MASRHEGPLNGSGQSPLEQHIAKDSPQSAQHEVEKILRRSWQLAGPPEIGHPVQGYDAAALREVLSGPYRLIYCLGETQIDVITVLHYRQLLPADLANLHRLGCSSPTRHVTAKGLITVGVPTPETRRKFICQLPQGNTAQSKK